MTISRKKGVSHYPKKVSETKHKKVENVLEKQMVADLAQRLSLHVGQFLVLTEEGSPTQIALAHQKAKSEFLKFSPEIARLAQHIGGDVAHVVVDFLDSIDVVLHSAEFLDEEKVSRCFHTTQQLERELKL